MVWAKAAVKVAVAVRSCDMSTTQSPVPVQAPLQPMKTEASVGVLTSRIDELLG